MRSMSTVEGRLQEKLANGEISQEEYEELYNKFQKLGMLDATTGQSKPKRQHWSFTGHKVIENSAKVNGPITVNGSLTVNGDLDCQKMNIAGNSQINGNLLVLQKVNVTGRLFISDLAKIGGKAAIAGKLEVGKDLVITDTLKSSGIVQVGQDIQVGESIKVGGKLYANNVLCAGAIKIFGRINTSGNVIGDSFKCPTIRNSQISGDLKAATIKISDVDTKGPMDKPFVNIITTVINEALARNMSKKTDMLVVKGSIHADSLAANYVEVFGDIFANTIILGSNVKVHGTVKYTDTLEYPPALEISAEKVESLV